MTRRVVHTDTGAIEVSKLSQSATRALLHTLQSLGEREGADMPSNDVQMKAVRLLSTLPIDRPGTTQPRSSLTVTIEGDTGTYDVALFTERPSTREVPKTGWNDLGPWRIIDGRCPCDARGTCSHLIAALAIADQAGYPLATT